MLIASSKLVQVESLRANRLPLWRRGHRMLARSRESECGLRWMCLILMLSRRLTREGMGLQQERRTRLVLAYCLTGERKSLSWRKGTRLMLELCRMSYPESQKPWIRTWLMLELC